MAAKKPMDTVVKLNIRVPEALAKRLKIECVRRDTTIQAAVQAAVEAWLKGGRP